MKNDFYSNIDLVSFLKLDKIFTAEEVDEFIESLNRELWYRVLNEDLKEKLGQKDWEKMVKELKNTVDINPVLKYIHQKHPQINIYEVILNQATILKKEFIEKYKNS